jgi:hypothetical protein
LSPGDLTTPWLLLTLSFKSQKALRSRGEDGISKGH